MNPCKGYWFTATNKEELDFIEDLVKDDDYLRNKYNSSICIWDDKELMRPGGTVEEFQRINDKYEVLECTFEEIKKVRLRVLVLGITVADPDTEQDI